MTLKTKRVRMVLVVATIFTVVTAILLGVLFYVRSNMGEVISLSASDVEKYEVYKLRLPAALEGEHIDVIEFLVKDSEIIETKTINEIVSTQYTVGKIPDYLYDYDKVEEVVKLNIEARESIYITYTSADGHQVILCYNSGGFSNMSIYNERKDECIEITTEAARKYTNFRYGKFRAVSEDVGTVSVNSK